MFVNLVIEKLQMNQKPLSYSSLKRLLEHPQLFLHPKKFTSKYFDVGNIFDAIISKTFDEKYIVLDYKKPKPQVKEYIEKSIHCEDEECFLKIYEDMSIKKLSFSKFIESVKKEEDYLNLLKNNEKIIVHKDDYDNIIDIIDFLKEEYSEYFENTESDLFQFDDVFEYKNLLFRIICDWVKIDKKNKIITVIDLKTTSFLPGFKENIKKYMYTLQAYLYLLYFKTKYPDYTIVFEWMVVNSNKKECNVIELNSFQEYEGEELFNEAIKRYEFHTKKDWWEDVMENYKPF